MANPTKTIPNKQSQAAQWIMWHKTMKGRYGQKQANILFLKAWDMRGGAGSSASTNELREYMKDNGVTLDATVLEDIQDATYSGLESIGSVFTAGKYVVIALGVIVIGGLAMVVFNVAKQPVKAASSLAGVKRLR